MKAASLIWAGYRHPIWAGLGWAGVDMTRRSVQCRRASSGLGLAGCSGHWSPTSPPSGHGCSQTNITLNLETCSYFLSSPSTPTPTPHEISPWWTVDNLQFEFWHNMVIKHGDVRGPLLPPGLATSLPQVYGTMELSSVTLGSGVWCHHTMRGDCYCQLSYPP